MENKKRFSSDDYKRTHDRSNGEAGFGGGNHHGRKDRGAGVGEPESFLQVKDLVVEYTAGSRIVHAVNRVTFDLKHGESIGIVGESGCGKSTIAKAILGILPDRGARIASGDIWF